MYPPSDAEHHVLVLQGPGVQRGQTEISVDDVRCHQWLTNQIVEATLHSRHEPTSIHQVSVADTSSAKPPVYSCRLPRGSMLEQNKPYQCLVQVYFGADTERTAIPYPLENSSLNRQVQSCVEHPVSSSH